MCYEKRKVQDGRLNFIPTKVEPPETLLNSEPPQKGASIEGKKAILRPSVRGKTILDTTMSCLLASWRIYRTPYRLWTRRGKNQLNSLISKSNVASMSYI